MRKVTIPNVFLLAGFLATVSFLDSCKKFEPGSDLVIASDHVEVFAPGEYRFHGYLINIGDEEVINHGFNWDLGRDLGPEGHFLELGRAETERRYTGDLILLGENTAYSFRAFAATPSGTEFGLTIEFTTGGAPRIPFDQITREQILTIALSEELINGYNNASNQIPPGTILFYRTNEGRYGKLQIVVYGYSIEFRWLTFNEDGAVHSAGDNLHISGTWSADLDAGIQVSHDDNINVPDFQWQQVTDIVRYLTPRNGAVFYKYYTE